MKRFEILCKQTQKYLEKYLRKYTQNKAIIEDAIQYGLIQLWEMVQNDRAGGDRHLRKMEHYIDSVRSIAYRKVKEEQEHQKNEISGLDIEWETIKKLYHSKTSTASDMEIWKDNDRDTNL